MTSAIAGLKANMTGLDVTGNNVSNVNTDSFKSSSVSFRDTMYQQINGGSANSANTAGINPSQIGYGATASSVDVDFTKGGKNSTGKSSDVYIDGDAFFVVGNSAKAAANDTFTGYKYTRLGKLSTDSAGYLNAGEGNYVCGYVYDPATKKMGTTLQAIKLPTPAYRKDHREHQHRVRRNHHLRQRRNHHNGGPDRIVEIYESLRPEADRQQLLQQDG
jgi:flagellar hook protein FlgE